MSLSPEAEEPELAPSSAQQGENTDQEDEFNNSSKSLLFEGERDSSDGVTDTDSEAGPTEKEGQIVDVASDRINYRSLIPLCFLQMCESWNTDSIFAYVSMMVIGTIERFFLFFLLLLKKDIRRFLKTLIRRCPATMQASMPALWPAAVSLASFCRRISGAI